MNDANKKSEAELNQLCQAFLFNLQFINTLNAKHSTFMNTLRMTLARKLDVSYNIVHIRRRLLLIFDHGLSEALQDLLVC